MSKATKDEVLRMRLTADQKKRVRALADATGLTMSELFRSYVDNAQVTVQAPHPEAKTHNQQAVMA